MVRWLVVGIGDITKKRVIPAILSEPRSVLAGFVTRDPAKAAAWPGTQAWTSLDAALANPGIDAVYVATPVVMHAAQTIASLRAGKHVLCEKPVGMNFDEAKSIAEVAESAKGLCGIAYYRRLYPKLRRTKQLIESGAIGRPVLVEANCHSPLETENRDWLRDPAFAGGGPLYDTASHRIDAANFLLGTPKRATGMRSNAVHGLAVEDAATALIDYESGARAIIDVCWDTVIRRDEFRITGTTGEIVMSPLNGPRLTVNGVTEELPCHANAHYPLIEDFVSAILEGRAPVCPVGEAIETDRVTSAVMLSEPCSL